MLDTTTRAGRAPLLALATAASVVALTATAPQVDAAFVIDDFSSPDPGVLLPELDFGSGPVPGTFDSFTTSGVGDGLATRTVSTTSSGSGNTGLGAGSLTFNNGFGDQVTTISYAFGTPVDIDATGDRFVFDFRSTDSIPGSSNINFPIDVTVSDSAGSETAQFLLLAEGATAPGPTAETLLFSAYSSVDLSDVTGLEVVLDTTGFAGAPDFSINSIAAVPLPGALPLFLGGLAGVGYVVRRRQRQAAAAWPQRRARDARAGPRARPFAWAACAGAATVYA